MHAIGYALHKSRFSNERVEVAWASQKLQCTIKLPDTFFNAFHVFIIIILYHVPLLPTDQTRILYEIHPLEIRNRFVTNILERRLIIFGNRLEFDNNYVYNRRMANTWFRELSEVWERYERVTRTVVQISDTCRKT